MLIKRASCRDKRRKHKYISRAYAFDSSRLRHNSLLNNIKIHQCQYMQNIPKDAH